MQLPAFSESDYKTISSLIKVTSSLPARIKESGCTLDHLRHTCTNYDNIRRHNPFVKDLCLLMGTDIVTAYVKLIVNNKLTLAILNIIHNERDKQALVYDERTDMLTIELNSAQKRALTLKAHSDELQQRYDHILQLNSQLKAENDALATKNDYLKERLDADNLALDQLVAEAVAEATRTLNDRIANLEASNSTLTLKLEETTLKLDETTLKLEETTLKLEETTLKLEETTAKLDDVYAQLDEIKDYWSVQMKDFEIEVVDAPSAASLLHKTRAAFAAIVLFAHHVLLVQRDPDSPARKVRLRQLSDWLPLLYEKLNAAGAFVDVSLDLQLVSSIAAKHNIPLSTTSIASTSPLGTTPRKGLIPFLHR
jgi:hypothetical protein